MIERVCESEIKKEIQRNKDRKERDVCRGRGIERARERESVCVREKKDTDIHRQKNKQSDLVSQRERGTGRKKESERVSE